MGKKGSGLLDIQSSKVVAPPVSIEDRMLDLWGPVYRHSLMIVVVGRYPTIPLEMFSGIVYRLATDSPVYGIMWKTCTSERWDPD
jgi:hypothetical protein